MVAMPAIVHRARTEGLAVILAMGFTAIVSQGLQETFVILVSITLNVNSFHC